MTFTFVCAEHKEFGGLGWRLKSQPDFDPLSGMTVAHDCLEHFNNSALPADEFKALGAMFWVRGEDYFANKGSHYTNPGVHAASDLPEIMRHIVYEDMRLPPAPKTKPLDEYVEGYIDTMFSSFKKEFDDERDDLLEVSPQLQRSITSYMRIGYRKAGTRFGFQRYQALNLFRQIEQQSDQALRGASEFEELLVKVSFRGLTAVVSTRYPEDDYA